MEVTLLVFTNLKLQGKKHIITQMYDHVKSFKVKLCLWKKQLVEGNVVSFPTLKLIGKVEPKSLQEYVELLSNLQQQFNVRFSDFAVLQTQFQIFLHRFL